MRYALIYAKKEGAFPRLPFFESANIRFFMFLRRMFGDIF